MANNNDLSLSSDVQKKNAKSADNSNPSSERRPRPSVAELARRSSEWMTANAAAARQAALGKGDPPSINVPDPAALRWVPVPPSGIVGLLADTYPDDIDNSELMAEHMRNFLASNPQVRDPDSYRVGEMVQV
jgi:hypothetical protein